MRGPEGQGSALSRSGLAPDIPLHEAGEMAALLTHQIAQPLAAISNFAAAAEALLQDSVDGAALPGNSTADASPPGDPGPNDRGPGPPLGSPADASERLALPCKPAAAFAILQAIGWLQKISEQTRRAGDLLGLLRRMANRSRRQATPELSAIVREAIEVAERVTLGDGAVEIGQIASLELPRHHGWELETMLALLLRHCLSRDSRPQLDTLVSPADFEIRVEIRDAGAAQPQGAVSDASAAAVARDSDARLLCQVRDSAEALGGRLWATERPFAGRRAFHLLLPRRGPAESQVEGTLHASTASPTVSATASAPPAAP